MDYFIIIVVTVTGLYFHWWIYQRIRLWVDRDLALSFAGSDEAKRQYMLDRLNEARQQRIKRSSLPDWLEQAADHYRS